MNTARSIGMAILLALLGTAGAAANSGELELRGETKERVRSSHGEPERIRGPVGDPPITRWLYSDFTVVFEYDRVLHSFQRQPELENRSADASAERPDRGDTLDMPE